MTCHVFRPRRRVNGRLKISRLYSGKLRLGWERAISIVALGVTDKRVAEQKLAEIVRDREREHAGILAPAGVRQAAPRPISDHLAAFLADLSAKGRAEATVNHYRKIIPKLCQRCGWQVVGDITPQSFCEWRAASGLSAKFLNDQLGAACALLNWMQRLRLILANPLQQVEKAVNDNAGNYRRALSVEEAARLIAVASAQRSAVYVFILYTGLRRKELNALRWSDFHSEENSPHVIVSGKIAKNRKPATLLLRAEAVEALKRIRPENSAPSDFAFCSKVPSVAMLRRDLEAAGIPFTDERGRRLDVHALRTTFGTLLSAAGVSAVKRQSSCSGYLTIIFPGVVLGEASGVKGVVLRGLGGRRSQIAWATLQA